MTSAASSAFARGKEQLRQRARGDLALGIDLEYAAIQLGCAGRFVEHVLLEARPFGENGGALIFGPLGRAQLEEPAQVVASIFAAQQLVERGDRVFVGRVFFDQRAVLGDGVVDATELGGVQARELGLQTSSIFGGDPLLLTSRAVTASM